MKDVMITPHHLTFLRGGPLYKEVSESEVIRKHLTYHLTQHLTFSKITSYKSK